MSSNNLGATGEVFNSRMSFELLVNMASSDIENCSSEFAFSEIASHSVSPSPDLKSSSARQERPPLEVSNASNYSCGESHVPEAATTEARKETMPTTIEEHSRVFGLEKPWDFEMNYGDRAIHRRAVKHMADDMRKEFANRWSSVTETVPSESEVEAEDEETVGQTDCDQHVSRGLDVCNFFEEIIDMEREAGFGEQEDFGGQEEQAKSKLCDEDEELSIYEQCRFPSFSSNEDFPTNSNELELSLGGTYDDHDVENATEAATQIEKGEFQNKGNNTSSHENRCNWLKLSSSHEEEGSEPSQRDFWEEERLKMQLEEEVLMWKDKCRRMKHRRRGPYTSNIPSLGKNSSHVDHVMRDMLAELRMDEEDVVSEVDDAVGCKKSIVPPETNGNSYKLMVMAFEELLREVEATANKNRKELDDVLRAKEEAEESMQRERRLWFETENQLRSRISSLEIQHGRMSDTLRETAGSLTVEQERRKDSRCELDRVMEVLVKEKKLHHETVEKLNTYVRSFMNLREALATHNSLVEDRSSMYLERIESVLKDMDLQSSFNLTTESSDKNNQLDSERLDTDELNRMKQQLNRAEAERDEIEERLSTLLRETREGHGEMEALWLERENLLEQKVGCLEAELHHLHSKRKRKEAEAMIERERWADELEKCMQAWARERNAWEGKMKDRTADRGRLEVARGHCESRGCAKRFVGGSGDEWEEGGKMMKKPESVEESEHDAAHLESNDQISLDVGNLVMGTEKVLDIECDDQKLIKVQREKIEEWRRLAEQYKQERRETEKKLSASLILITKLEQEIKAKEEKMEEEKSRMEELLANKSAVVEKLKQSLKSKERDLEVTIQKFTDELKLIDKEVERERKEREQVMELHFASKRQLVCDIKAKEESWERALEVRNNELQMIEKQVEIKQQNIEELERKLDEEKTLRERTDVELEKEKTLVRKEMEEMLADIWRVCEEEKIQAVAAKKLLPGGDLSLRRPMWESLWLEYCRAREISDNAKVLPSTLEWEFARGKVARFEKKITEAMSAIKSLRGEIKAKEEQLLKVKADREQEWEKKEEDWARERERLLHLVDSLQQKEVQHNEEKQSRELEYIKRLEAMEELRKIEHEEAAAIISSLRGSTRELEWCLNRTNSLPSRRVDFPARSSTFRGSSSHSFDKDKELVQVPASSLEDLDRYLFDLESRKEAGETRLRNSETGIEGDGLETSKEERGVNKALRQLENELSSTSESECDFIPMLGIDDDGRLSPRVSREWTSSLCGSVPSGARRARRRVVRPLERGMCLTLNGLHTLTQESYWTEEADGNSPIWQPESHKRSWTSDEMQSDPGSQSPTRGYIALPAPSTATRRPQKWLVDVSWLEQVRKEHAWLRQQLEIERQRVSALGRVEADNRCIEAAIIRALELKRQSDAKAAEMQRKLAAMETLFSSRKWGTRNS